MSTVSAGSLFNVDGIVAVVTGGGTGIGKMMTIALAENGARKVYIVGRREDKLNELAAKYPNAQLIQIMRLTEHSVVEPMPGDITSQDQLKAMAERRRGFSLVRISRLSGLAQSKTWQA
ncbi:MAG: hypothetical protein LQ351_002196 [Letrouitia transgressa]|nr:MAG: hypothetical protein LQ351_002196 [Letrouitia transgressa]